MNSHETASGWDFNPYEPPRTALGRARPPAAGAPFEKKGVAVTHDLSDAELRRFVDFDVFYDPKPLFGFLPQWVLIAVGTAVLGALPALLIERLTAATFVPVVAAPVALFVALERVVAERRRKARALGLCDGRVVTVSTRGLCVEIPEARRTTMLGIGPMLRPWSEIRSISADERDITFWMCATTTDVEGRTRVVVPRRAFANPADADAFEYAARAWHAAAHGDQTGWWDEDSI